MIKSTYSSQIEFAKLIVASVLIGLTCTLLGDSLMMLTEKYEHIFFALAKANPILYFIFPLVGLSLIYVFRHYFFRKRQNRGIIEVTDSLKTRHNELPAYKIPSHFINGLVTVIFGGSSGIEVPSVVASASIGSVLHKKAGIHHLYRKELICAGVAAAVTVLFNSPIAGAFFALEVILKKVSKNAIISIAVSVCTTWALARLLNAQPLFSVRIVTWHYYAFPYFILLGILSGLNSVYLTKAVLFFKDKFSQLTRNSSKILLGSLIIGSSLFLFPQLYGDGYLAIGDLFQTSDALRWSYPLIYILLGIIVLKPIITATTLASGGDGGVFAPSLFIGAFLGLFVALALNTFFHVNVIPMNFMVVGMAAVLSASLHAPFTAAFLLCGVVNDYTLIIPILTASMAAKITAKLVIPYTVYTYPVLPAK